MTQVQFRLLGPVEVAAGERVLSLGATKHRALLAVLLLHPNEFVSRDRLVDELWGGRAPPGAAHNLEVYVSRLRKALRADGDAETPLMTRPGGYLLRLESDQLDVAEFELLLARGQDALAGGDATGAAAALEEALALWRGEPLADLAREPFAEVEVERLGELRLRALSWGSSPERS
jgi:DNA-binding SARP family transcriptional activator